MGTETWTFRQSTCGASFFLPWLHLPVLSIMLSTMPATMPLPMPSTMLLSFCAGTPTHRFTLKSATMKVTACGVQAPAYGYAADPYHGEHQVCHEEYQTRPTRSPLSLPLSQSSAA